MSDDHEVLTPLERTPKESVRNNDSTPWTSSSQDQEADTWEVRAGCIGRGHAGKTAIFRALSEGPVGDFFPSGLHVDVGDPKEVAQMIREAEETQELLRASGLPPTQQAAQMRYYLYDGDDRRVVYKMREVIGQVLTHTLPDSSEELQARYDDYLRSLLDTHVLWVVIPTPPPNPSSRDRRRYSNDLRIASAYLREALRLRRTEQPAAVALIISKIDTLYKEEEDAREVLTNQLLRDALGPLVHVVEKSRRAADAVILPVTAFGFGNAVLREQGDQRHGEPTQHSNQDPFSEEPIWLLREGAAPQPYNLDTLVLWTLLFGLLNQEVRHTGETPSIISEICQMLRDDLTTEERWYLPIKGHLAQNK